ncbi:hypothetical protein BWD42_16620 [Sphingobacterium sp. CZ-UAM]|nr:hypothetical protein BWD42_16620 [Sphingobacterium sp. CZ-UAM]
MITILVRSNLNNLRCILSVIKPIFFDAVAERRWIATEQRFIQYSKRSVIVAPDENQIQRIVCFCKAGLLRSFQWSERDYILLQKE